MRKKGILIGFPVLLAALVFSFYQMGGFREIELEVLEQPNIELAGIRFRGIPQDKRLRESFGQIEQLLQEHPEAKLHTIYFREPAGKLDTMEVFVGLEKSALGEEPQPFEVMRFSPEFAIIATIKRHRLVMPGPEKVKREMREFAENNQLREPTMFIDRILGENEIQVIGLSPIPL